MWNCIPILLFLSFLFLFFVSVVLLIIGFWIPYFNLFLEGLNRCFKLTKSDQYISFASILSIFRHQLIFQLVKLKLFCMLFILFELFLAIFYLQVVMELNLLLLSYSQFIPNKVVLNLYWSKNHLFLTSNLKLFSLWDLINFLTDFA